MVLIYINKLTLWEKRQYYLIFKHFLNQKGNPCKCELIDSNPFHYFNESLEKRIFC
jgi:hypothetical protein